MNIKKVGLLVLAVILFVGNTQVFSMQKGQEQGLEPGEYLARFLGSNSDDSGLYKGGKWGMFAVFKLRQRTARRRRSKGIVRRSLRPSHKFSVFLRGNRRVFVPEKMRSRLIGRSYEDGLFAVVAEVPNLGYKIVRILPEDKRPNFKKGEKCLGVVTVFKLARGSNRDDIIIVRVKHKGFPFLVRCIVGEGVKKDDLASGTRVEIKIKDDYPFTPREAEYFVLNGEITKILSGEKEDIKGRGVFIREEILEAEPEEAEAEEVKKTEMRIGPTRRFKVFPWMK